MVTYTIKDNIEKIEDLDYHLHFIVRDTGELVVSGIGYDRNNINLRVVF